MPDQVPYSDCKSSAATSYFLANKYSTVTSNLIYGGGSRPAASRSRLSSPPAFANSTRPYRGGLDESVITHYRRIDPYDNYSAPYRARSTSRYNSPVRRSSAAPIINPFSPSQGRVPYQASVDDVWLSRPGDTGAAPNYGTRADTPYFSSTSNTRRSRSYVPPTPTTRHDNPLQNPQNISELSGESERHQTLRTGYFTPAAEYRDTRASSNVTGVRSEQQKARHVVESELAAERARARAMRGREELEREERARRDGYEY